MPTQFSRMDIAELALLALGALTIVGGAIVVQRRRAWKTILSIPDAPANVLEPADLLLALVAIRILPSAAYQLLTIGQPPPATSEPAIEVADPRNVAALALGQLLAVIVLIFLGHHRFQNGPAGWGLTTHRLGTRAGQALVSYIALWPICFLMLQLTVLLLTLADPNFKPPDHSAIQTLLSDQTQPWMIVVTIVSTIAIAPVLEELFFRGLLQPALIRWTGRPWMSILLGAVAFGLFHYPLIHTIPALTILGVILGYVYAKTGSLTLVILLHVAFNGKTLLWLAMGAV